jgi:hypothetical protein
MNAPAPNPATTTPAQRLAADVRAPLDLLRRGQREAADAARRQPPDIPLLLVADDLAVSVADLELVARDLERLGR